MLKSSAAKTSMSICMKIDFVVRRAYCVNYNKREKMNEEKIKSFQDLRVWQLGIEIVKEIYRLTECFPKNELNW